MCNYSHSNIWLNFSIFGMDVTVWDVISVRFYRKQEGGCFLIMHNKTKHARMKSPFQYHRYSATWPAMPKHLLMHNNIHWKIISKRNSTTWCQHITQRFQAGVHFTAKTKYFHPGNACSFLRIVLSKSDLFPKLQRHFGA